MKPKRPKFRQPSITDRVAEYDRQTPGTSAEVCAKELKLTKAQVWFARNAVNKRDKVVDIAPMSTKDIVTISRIGIAKTEQIIQLLKQLGKGSP